MEDQDILLKMWSSLSSELSTSSSAALLASLAATHHLRNYYADREDAVAAAERRSR